jgi:hypothetical protein
LQGLLHGGRLIEAIRFSANGECRFEHFGDQERAEEFMFGDMCEQVGVVLAQGGQEQVESDPDDVLSLCALGEDRFTGGSESLEGVEEISAE